MSVDAISGFAQLAATGMQAVGSIQQGNNQARAIEQNAKAEAAATSYNASQVQRETVAKENLLRRQNRAALGKQEAAMAQAGIAGSGTAVGVMDQSLVDAELDALTLRTNGMNNADAMRWQAQNTLAAGQNQAAAAKQGGYLGAAGLLAQGAAQAYGLYGKINTPGTTATTTPAIEQAQPWSLSGYRNQISYTRK